MYSRSPNKPLGALSPSSAFSELAPSEPASRRLWTAVSNHSSPSRTECACQPSQQARAREAMYSRYPNKPLGALSPSSAFSELAPLRTSQPKALDCCEQSQLFLAHGVRLPALPTSPGTRGSVLALSRRAPRSTEPQLGALPNLLPPPSHPLGMPACSRWSSEATSDDHRTTHTPTGHPAMTTGKHTK